HAQLLDPGRASTQIGRRILRRATFRTTTPRAATAAAAETAAVSHAYRDLRSILSFLGRRRNLGCRQGYFGCRQQRGRAENFHSCSAREFHDRTPLKTRVYTNWLLFEPVTLKLREVHRMLRVIMGAGLFAFTSCAALAQSP